MTDFIIQSVDGDTFTIQCVAQQGPAGPPGTGSAASFVTGETPSGAMNGANATFNTQFNFIPESVAVYCNGVRLKLGIDYTTTGLQTILLTFSPSSSERLTVDYQR